ncbi:MAG: DUF2760 domain-containing protein [Syntrophobacteraceae bacterium CG07_land_8_20_14_0_80_61_8]|nr:MAG: DUF2760 domain-containing protein [Syntrophobacteraceae bacterium CG07_land_8_20_14_0_80_61_8]
MQVKAKMSLYSLIWCLLFNGLLIAGLFLAAAQLLHGIDRWLQPLLGGSGVEMSDEARLAIGNLNNFLAPVRTYLAPAVFGLGAVATLLLWLFVQGSGRGLLARSAALPAPPAKTEAGGGGRREAVPASAGAAVAAAPPTPADHTSAVQILGILQRQGRLLDFLQEDLGRYQDDQIGAAVRNIHQDCKAALVEHIKLAPVFAQEEGSQVTVAKGFDVASVRLTGEVSGEPPFRGILRHRGWRVERVELPQITSKAGEDEIIAPAEVEVGA